MVSIAEPYPLIRYFAAIVIPPNKDKNPGIYTDSSVRMPGFSRYNCSTISLPSLK